MLHHYCSIFFKIFRKNKIPNLLNILGLAVGMMSAIIIAKYVGYSLMADSFHQHLPNIYQLSQVETKNGNTENVGHATYRGIVLEATQAIPEVVNFTRLDYQVETLLSVENEEGKIVSYNENRILGVDSAFLHIFTFNAIQGSAENAFSNPNTAVITQNTAHKYFGNKDPIGQTITSRVSWGKRENWTVICVLEVLPQNSSIQFDILLYKPLNHEDLWDSPVYNQYILSTPATKPDVLAQKITSHISGLTHFSQAGREISIQLNPFSPSLRSFEFMLVLVGLCILILSWINFINLSVAQSLHRYGEVVIRKALGSSHKQLIMQFVFESICMNCIALLLCLLCLGLSYDYFEILSGHHLLPLYNNSLHINTLFFLLFLIGSMLTSAYPSFFLVSKKIQGVPKVGKLTDRKGLSLRKGLVVAQFTISSIMLIGAYVISAQMDYMLSKDLGFNPTNKLIIKPPKDQFQGKQKRMRAIKNEFAKHSWVEQVSSSSTIPGQSYRQEVYFSLIGSDKKPMLYINLVDSSFIDSYGIKLVAGKSFSTDGGDNNYKVIINEATSKVLGLRPEEAILKELIDQEDGETYTIIGVIKDFHKLSLRDKIEPTLFKYNTRRGYLTVTFSPEATHSLEDKLAELKSSWELVYHDQPFEYFFLTDEFYAQYDAEQFFRKVFRSFTLVSVFLACFGLIGLSMFEVTNGKLEVGIRKTFGASSHDILVLFFRKYLFLLLTAITISLPVSYLLMNTWLEEYSFRIVISFLHILIPSLLLFLVAISTISLQIIKLSWLNPSKVLREE